MKKPRRRRGFEKFGKRGLFFAGPAVGADFGWVDAGRFEHAISGLVSQESKPSFSQMVRSMHFPRSVEESAYSSRCFWPSSPSSSWMTRRRNQVHLGFAAREAQVFAAEHNGRAGGAHVHFFGAGAVGEEIDRFA